MNRKLVLALAGFAAAVGITLAEPAQDAQAGHRRRACNGVSACDGCHGGRHCHARRHRRCNGCSGNAAHCSGSAEHRTGYRGDVSGEYRAAERADFRGDEFNARRDGANADIRVEQDVDRRIETDGNVPPAPRPAESEEATGPLPQDE